MQKNLPKMFRLFVVMCLFCITNIHISLGMTREQLKKTMTIMKKQCMPKNGVNNVTLDKSQRTAKNLIDDYMRKHWESKMDSSKSYIKKTTLLNFPDQVGEIEEGVFLEDHNVMCYIACIYKTIQVVRNNRLDKDLIIRQIDALYPADIKEAVKKSVAKCITVQALYEDPCEGIFYAARCLYADDPSKFIFP